MPNRLRLDITCFGGIASDNMSRAGSSCRIPFHIRDGLYFRLKKSFQTRMGLGPPGPDFNQTQVGFASLGNVSGKTQMGLQ
jgi:hypothetical protein